MAQEHHVTAPEDRIPVGEKIAYGMGAFVNNLLASAIGGMTIVLNLGLGMNPALVGLLGALPRLTDAITDPLMGYISDNTRSRWGRRRPYIFCGAIAVGLLFALLWQLPEGRSENFYFWFFLIGSFLFYLAYTVFVTPWVALGYELTPDYHERTRVFGARLLLLNLGAFTAVGCLIVIIRSDDVRGTVFLLAACIAAFTAVSIIWSALRLQERAELQGRGPQAVLTAYRDILGNPHARLLLLVFFIESLGGATIGVLTPYMADYVIGDISFPLVVVTYMVAQTLSVPVWTPLSRHFGKKTLWLFSMLVTSGGFGTFFLVSAGDHTMTYVLAAIVGAAAGCGNVIAPSVQSDIVDWDEWKTGERKEGGYFAGFNFVQKSAAGVTIMLTGFVLQLAGYVPNVEQTESAQLAIRALYALFPLTCYLIGAVLFTRFSLGEAEHSRIRAELEARRRATVEP